MNARAVKLNAKAQELLPRPVAVIMDGNGRWAKEQGLPRAEGHRRGAASAKMITRVASDLGIRYLTLYTFSSENWHRPKNEVSALMKLLLSTLRVEIKILNKNVEFHMTYKADITKNSFNHRKNTLQ